MRLTEIIRLHRPGRRSITPDVRWSRRLKDALAPCAVSAMQKLHRRRMGFEMDPRIEAVCIGERWLRGWYWRRFRACARRVDQVLVAGCGSGLGPDVGLWIANRVATVDACDVQSFNGWDALAQRHDGTNGARLRFFTSDLARLEVPSATYDVVYSEAVLEHVSQLDEAVAETARVLRDGGLSCHVIGPLYRTHGGDHCIAAYGADAGYDHLLLGADAYRTRILDDAFFARTADPHQAGWARRGWFSYARLGQYLDAFERHFRLEAAIAVLSPEGLRFRARRPEAWAELRAARHSEEDLLTKAVALIARKV